MDFITPIICIVAPSAVIGLMVTLKSIGRNHAAEKLMQAAKLRADKRVNERQFSDTEPEHDPYRSAIDFQNAMHVTVDDRFDGRGELTPEQAATISLIFDGFAPKPVQAPKNVMGPTSHQRAGVPFAQSIFGEDNRVHAVYKEANVA